jgi:hypothetical protein
MKNFFISYNSADNQWAQWIAWQLEEAGYTTVIQAWDFHPGSNFPRNAPGRHTSRAHHRRPLTRLPGRALPSARMGCRLCPDPTGIEGTLLPVRVRECQPKGLLFAIIYTDEQTKPRANPRP